MAQVHPFRGVRYAPGTDYARVVTPPYDVIDAAAQKVYHDRDPHSIIRLELGYESPTDTESDNRYTRAAATCAAWLEEGVLRPEGEPALYLYEEEFAQAGRRYRRTSFFAAVSVTDYGPGLIMPHEHTLAKPVEDRLNLLRASGTNFSPIFGLFMDPGGQVAGTLRGAAQDRSPDVAFTDEAGTDHRMWVVTDPAAQQRVAQFLAPRSIYIADGHHRYQTALRISRENPDLPGSDRVLMVLAAVTDPGLVVLPTHRVVANLGQYSEDALLKALAAHFTVEPWPGAGTGTAGAEGFLGALAGPRGDGPALGMYTGSRACILTLQNPAAMAAAAPDHSPAWRQLDVAVLQTLVLDQLLGIGAQETTQQKNLTYTRDPREAIAQVQAGTAQLAFLMNPLPVTAVTSVADARDNMPPKSTYFYPKALTGLVMHRLALSGAPR